MRRPSPSMWYNANGYEWGQLGPHGEMLDQEGNRIPERKSTGIGIGMVLAFLVILALGALGVINAWWSGSFDSRHPTSIPTTYGHPCGPR